MMAMILNPYYYIFTILFKKLKAIKVEHEVPINDILFILYGLLFLLFIPHFIIFMIILKDYNIFSVSLKNIPREVFGIGFSLSFLLFNYLLFQRKDRYKKVLETYDNSSKFLKLFNLTILIVYFITPLLIVIFM